MVSLTARRLLAAVVVAAALAGCQADYGDMVPSARCDNVRALALMAQAVPAAQEIPCVRSGVALATDWYLANLRASSGSAAFLYSPISGGTGDPAGESVEVTLTGECDVRGATEVPSDEEGARRFERVELQGDRYRGTRYYLFQGGCVTYGFNLSEAGRSAVINDVTRAVSLRSRHSIAEELDRRSDGLLSGL